MVLTVLLATAFLASGLVYLKTGSPDVDHYPAVVGIMIQKTDKKTICSGTIIQPEVIITVAHCLQDLVSAKVVPGDKISRTNNDTYEVASWKMHPEYTGNHFKSTDIGLIYLEKPLAIKTWPSFRPDFLFAPGAILTRIGFGKRDEMNIKTVMQEVVTGKTDDYIKAKDDSGVKGDSGGPVFSEAEGKNIVGLHTGRGINPDQSLKDVSYIYPLTTKHLTWINQEIITYRQGRHP